MTAFKTYEELGITAEEHAALIATIGVLEQEQIILDMGQSCNVQPPGVYDSFHVPTPPCGTNCCIGGTMSILMQNGMKLPDLITPEMGAIAAKFVNDREDDNRGLHALFWDETSPDTTPETAIKAIQAFLGGETFDPWTAADEA